jgi:hypothetical protein
VPPQPAKNYFSIQKKKRKKSQSSSTPILGAQTITPSAFQKAIMTYLGYSLKKCPEFRY